MISTTRKVTVGNTSSTINTPIILYKGDKGIRIIFEINSKLKFIDDANLIESSNASYGQLVIKNNDGVYLFSTINPCEEGKVALDITANMTDEIRELGSYTFQIRLYDSTKESRITLPPVTGGIEIREPIAE